MKNLFLYLRTKIMAVPSIAWVDLDKGQLSKYDPNDGERPAIDFPAVLLKIEMPRTTKLSRKEQQGEVHITTTLVFDFMDDTDSITPDDILQQSLKVYDIAEEVHKALQGEVKAHIIRSPLERTSLRDPDRPDKLKVIKQTYTTYTIV